MNQAHIEKIAEELSIHSNQVVATAELFENGATVPFIARYRKEATGSLDEVVITNIRDRLQKLEDLDKRREAMLKSLQERDLLNEELEQKLLAAEKMTTLEDIYLPYRPKRRTKATVAREKGLEELARRIFQQSEETDPKAEAERFIDLEKGVESVDAALSGARDIMAEWINENQEAREKIRALYAGNGEFHSTVIPGREADGAKFRDYFDWKEPVKKAPSHRVLAMRRGEKEVVLSLKVDVPEEKAIALLETLVIRGEGPCSDEVKVALKDGFKRLLSGAMTTEIRMETKSRADQGAIKVFADNLRELLLAPPLGQKNVLAIDPGMRTGCKVVSLDRQGKFLQADTIYLFGSEQKRSEAASILKKSLKKYQVEAIAVGNGTGSRETISFLENLVGSVVPENTPIVMVNESGASIYSASEVARSEFPDMDVSMRGAVSIGRRLLDPLAELVKIDPKSIGVGQYQHDVDQKALRASLDDVVVSCVNAVGVDVNTASEHLLTYVSGFGPQLAKQTVQYRDENGPFSSRKGLSKVPRLGPKAFEQAAGFLRIRDGENPLDGSAVHPESYAVVERMAVDVGCSVKALIGDKKSTKKINPAKYITDSIGLPTINDIIKELVKPGRDPRDKFETFSFAEGVEKLEDLRPGMQIPGVVTNVTAFGAFVDVGVHQDGLVHISELANVFVKDPHDIVKVHQKICVTVLDVDLERKRISLSMKQNVQNAQPAEKTPSKYSKTQKKKPFKKSEAADHNPFVSALKDFSG